MKVTIYTNRLLTAHDAVCDCNMGRGKQAHEYKSAAEQAADFARRDAIAMRLKEQGRL